MSGSCEAVSTWLGRAPGATNRNPRFRRLSAPAPWLGNRPELVEKRLARPHRILEGRRVRIQPAGTAEAQLETSARACPRTAHPGESLALVLARVLGYPSRRVTPTRCAGSARPTRSDGVVLARDRGGGGAVLFEVRFLENEQSVVAPGHDCAQFPALSAKTFESLVQRIEAR